MASNNINVGSAANDGEGQTLRAAFINVRKNFAQMFGITYTSDTQDLSGATFSSDVITQGSTNKFLRDGSVGATELNVTGNGTSGQILKSDGDGTFSWINNDEGDITGVASGTGLSGGGTGGNVTLSLASSVQTEITANTNKTGITSAQITAISNNSGKTGFPGFGTSSSTALVGNTDLLQLGSTGSTALAGNTRTITSGEITNISTNNSKTGITSTQANEISANTLKTGITSGQANEITANNSKTSFPGFGTSGSTALVGNTALLQLGSSGSTALVGNTRTITSGEINNISTNSGKTGITSAQITAISTNSGKTSNATHSGDVSGSVALTIGASKVTTAKIANDSVTHDKLENRFTQKVSVSNRSGATSIDWSTGAVFVMANSINGNIEFDFSNFKTGQTIDIYNLTGAHTITFDSNASSSETFNKCGGVDYNGTSTNLIQVQCVDDSATAVFNYAVSAYVSDTTPS